MKIVPNFVVETIQLMPVLNCQCYCQMTSHSGILYYVIKTIVLIQVSWTRSGAFYSLTVNPFPTRDLSYL